MSRSASRTATAAAADDREDGGVGNDAEREGEQQTIANFDSQGAEG